LVGRFLLEGGGAPANLSVWVPEDGVLYTGDCLINEYLPNLDAGMPADWQIWLESLDRISALKPAIVVAGHGPVVQRDDVGKVIGIVRRVLKESLARGTSPTG
jgi:glyoxylase-like metal-dependent hydrolase (beta-lactamase superfamily II)